MLMLLDLFNAVLFWVSKFIHLSIREKVLMLLDLFNAVLFLASKFIYFIIREKSADVRLVQRSVFGF